MVYTAVPLLPMIAVNMRCFGCGDTDVGEKQNPPVYGGQLCLIVLSLT